MFEYTKADRKFHKLVDIQGLFNDDSINLTHEHVVRVIIEKHNVLEQVPMEKIEVLIYRLICNMNNNLKRSKTTGNGRLINDGSNHSDSCVEVTRDESSATSPAASRKFHLTDASKKSNHDKGIKSSSQPEKIPMVNKTISSVLKLGKEHLSITGDLNKVSTEELLRAKGKMNEAFELAKVMPGDTNYEYDKRVDFEEPDEESSWD